MELRRVAVSLGPGAIGVCAGLAEEPGRLCRFAVGAQGYAQFIETDRYIRVILAQAFPTDRQSLAQQRLRGLAVARVREKGS